MAKVFDPTPKPTSGYSALPSALRTSTPKPAAAAAPAAQDPNQMGPYLGQKTQSSAGPNSGGLESIDAANPFGAGSSTAAPQGPTLGGLARTPYEDPSFLAYMRGMGVDEANMRAEIAMRQANLQAQNQLQQPMFDQQLLQGNRNIGGNAEANGMFNSGSRLRDQQEFSNGIGLQRAGAQLNTSQQMAGNDFSMAQSQAAAQRGAAEAALTARVNMGLSNAQNGNYNG